MTTTITYTFRVDHPIPALRGQTVTGGTPMRHPQHGECVTFGSRINGQPVIARVAANPGLGGLVAQYEADLASEIAARAENLERMVPGWHIYSAAMDQVSDARAAYDAAAERGYPVAEAGALKTAEQARAEAATMYLQAAAYGALVEMSRSAHDVRAHAAAKAIEHVVAGDVPAVDALAAATDEWARYCVRSVD